MVKKLREAHLAPRISLSKNSSKLSEPTLNFFDLKCYNSLFLSAAGVYCAAVLEYLAAEVLEVSGTAAHASRLRNITPRHIKLAIDNDDELAKLCSNVTIKEGGVVPHIEEKLLPKSRKAK